MTHSWSRAAGAAAVVAMAFLAASAAAKPPVKKSESADVVVWRIDEPEVRSRAMEYPDVSFAPGDVVVLEAGGCVQTGGSGKTWKRYVKPMGPGSDERYHALVRIAGATPEGQVMRLGCARGRRLKVAPTAGPASTLWLGYEDDHYEDNGYAGHDDGTDAQCKGQDGGPAWVEISVHKHGSAPEGAPLDLDGAPDISGVPVNPTWHVSTPDPDCCFGTSGCFGCHCCTTDEVSLDAAVLPNDIICSLGARYALHGHLNWWPASYGGTLRWNELSDDGDYNFWLDPDQGAGLVLGQGAIGLEFDSREVQFRSPWWRRFTDEVSAATDRLMKEESTADAARASVRALLEGADGRTSVVGLLGLDCEHGCATELHPVYALAAHVKDDPDDDVWAVMARNWGNEGFCSHLMHFLDATPITLHLPWRKDAQSVTKLDRPGELVANHPDVRGPVVTAVPGREVLVQVWLPLAQEGGAKPLLDGALHLRWQAAAGRSLAPGGPPPRPAARAAAAAAGEAPEEEAGSAEAHLRRLSKDVRKKPPGVGAKPPAPVGPGFEPKPLPPERPRPPGAAPPPRPRDRHAEAAEKLRQDQQMLRELCEAHGGKLPDVPGACERKP